MVDGRFNACDIRENCKTDIFASTTFTSLRHGFVPFGVGPEQLFGQHLQDLEVNKNTNTLHDGSIL